MLILERNGLAAEALMSMLDSDPRLDPVGYSLNSREAIELVAACEPDCVIVGANLVGLDQLDFYSSVHEHFPKVRLIALPLADCFLTSCSSDELLHAISAADTRQATFEPDLRPVGGRSARRSVRYGAGGHA